MCGGKTYYVYILASRSLTLYVGVTNNLKGRVWQHKQGEIQGFSRCYHVDRLVCYEVFADVHTAIAREKQIKRWRRDKKVARIVELPRGVIPPVGDPFLEVRVTAVGGEADELVGPGA